MAFAVPSISQLLLHCFPELLLKNPFSIVGLISYKAVDMMVSTDDTNNMLCSVDGFDRIVAIFALAAVDTSMHYEEILVRASCILYALITPCCHNLQQMASCVLLPNTHPELRTLHLLHYFSCGKRGPII